MLYIRGGHGSGCATNALCHPTYCNFLSLPLFLSVLPPSCLTFKYRQGITKRYHKTLAKADPEQVTSTRENNYEENLQCDTGDQTPPIPTGFIPEVRHRNRCLPTLVATQS